MQIKQILHFKETQPIILDRQLTAGAQNVERRPHQAFPKFDAKSHQRNLRVRHKAVSAVRLLNLAGKQSLRQRVYCINITR
jgi:hypothetical protein